MNRSQTTRKVFPALFAGFILSAGIGTAHAVTTYYVDGGSNGNDTTHGGTSPTDAYKTVSKGFASLSSGDTLLIAGATGGITYETTSVLSLTSKTGITIDAYGTGGDPANRPIIKDSTTAIPIIHYNSGHDGIHLTSCSSVVIRNLRVWNEGGFGIHIDNGSNNIVEWCGTDLTGNSGIDAYNSSNITIRYNTVSRAVQGGSQECITMNKCNGFAAYGNSVTNRISDVHDGDGLGDGGEGIDAKNGSSNGVIRDNYIEDIGRKNLYFDGTGNDHVTGANCDIFRNVVNNRTAKRGVGISVACEAGTATSITSNVGVFNNIVYNATSGFDLESNGGGTNHIVDRVRVYHNTFDTNSNGVYLSSWHTDINGTPDYTEVSHLYIRYNVVTNCSSQKIWLNGNWNSTSDSGYRPAILPSTIVSSSNVVTGTSGWEGYKSSNINSAPLYLGGTTFPSRYMLLSGSVGIGVDTDDGSVADDASSIGLDYRFASRGSVRDAGAFEYNPTSTLVFEAEKLDVVSYKCGPDGGVRNLGPDSNLSNSDGIILDGTAVGDYITFMVPSVPQGSYQVIVKWKGGSNRGKFNIGASVEGTQVTSNFNTAPIDENTAIYPGESLVGTWAPGTTSNKWFKFSAAGTSGNGYVLTVDYIKLVPN